VLHCAVILAVAGDAAIGLGGWWGAGLSRFPVRGVAWVVVDVHAAGSAAVHGFGAVGDGAVGAVVCAGGSGHLGRGFLATVLDGGV
jgi:hypothetical protein